MVGSRLSSPPNLLEGNVNRWTGVDILQTGCADHNSDQSCQTMYAAKVKLSPFVFKVLDMYFNNILILTHLDFTSKIIKLLRAQIDISGNGSQRV